MPKAKAVFRDESYCDGHGMLVCHCGGDLCVCGRDGEDCFGCEKCEDRYDDDDFDEPVPPAEYTEPKA